MKWLNKNIFKKYGTTVEPTYIQKLDKGEEILKMIAKESETLVRCGNRTSGSMKP